MADKMTLAQVREKAGALREAANDIADFRVDNLANLSSADRQRLLDKEDEIRVQAQKFENDALDIIWTDLQSALREMREATDKMRDVRKRLTNIRRALSYAGAALGLGVAIASGNFIAVGTASLEMVNLVNTFREEDDAEAQAEDDAVS